MSLSEVVDTQYRIHVADLRGQEWEWRVVNVSYQGVEKMAPVLHLDGLLKRFVLDAEQSRQMMSLTSSPMPEEWIGAKIRVAPAKLGDNGTIVITAVELSSHRSRWLQYMIDAPWLLRLVAAALLLLAIILLAWLSWQVVSGIEQAQSFWFFEP